MVTQEIAVINDPQVYLADSAGGKPPSTGRVVKFVAPSMSLTLFIADKGNLVSEVLEFTDASGRYSVLDDCEPLIPGDGYCHLPLEHPEMRQILLLIREATHRMCIRFNNRRDRHADSILELFTVAEEIKAGKPIEVQLPSALIGLEHWYPLHPLSVYPKPAYTLPRGSTRLRLARYDTE